MKPTQGGMLEEEYLDEFDIVCHFALMITESREPGHLGNGEHVRDDVDEIDRKGREFEQRVKQLWHDGCPVNVEVLLHPECTECQPAAKQVLKKHPMNWILLERWSLCKHPASRYRDRSERMSSLRELRQAVLSHLYFSQLSAWQQKTRGKYPRNVAYALTVPGDDDCCRFLEDCAVQHHQFPLMSFHKKQTSLGINVHSLARSSHIPAVSCIHRAAESSSGLSMDRFPPPKVLGYPGQLDKLTKPKDVAIFASSAVLAPPKLASSLPIDVPCPVPSAEPHTLESPKVLMSTDVLLLDESAFSQEQQSVTSDSFLSPCKRQLDASIIPTFKRRLILHESLPAESESDLVDDIEKEFPTASFKNVRSAPELEFLKRQLAADRDKAATSPDEDLKRGSRRSLDSALAMVFHSKAGIFSHASPAPVRKSQTCFGFDAELTNPKAIKKVLSLPGLKHLNKEGPLDRVGENSTCSALVGKFEECLLNGCMTPAGLVEGFAAEIGASGAFFPSHKTLPVAAFFFKFSEHIAQSPYLGHIDLRVIGKKGYHVPRNGTVQVTLFNPNHTVVKMFVVMYDFRDMPNGCQTFLRQKTVYLPLSPDVKPVLRYLIHLRFATSSTGKLYLHTDIRMIFARNRFDIDSKQCHYKLQTYSESPTNPKYSPKKQCCKSD